MLRTLLVLGGMLLAGSWLAAAELPAFDFLQPAGRRGWQPLHDLGPLEETPEGLALALTGPDPYLAGPARDYPPDTPLRLRLKLRSDEGGQCQVFYFRDQATETDSVRFPVPAGKWYEAKVRLPALGPGYRLRVDPPGKAGRCVLADLRFEPSTAHPSPKWPKPVPPVLGERPARVESGQLTLLHGRSAYGGFEVHVSRKRMASGYVGALVGYLHAGQARWFAPGTGPQDRVTVQEQAAVAAADRQPAQAVRVRVRATDPDGANWEIDQSFAPGAPGTIAVATRLAVDRDRELLHLPILWLLPGLGDTGSNKTQALLPGIEYLENEPSSSTADLNRPAADRQVPSLHKLTFPLMAVAADDRYVGLMWSRGQNREVCAAFDTPDRWFGSGAQVLGLLFPGSDGQNRDESSLLPFDPVRLEANRPLQADAVIVGGPGSTVVPAVQQYVALQGLPPLPAAGGDAAGYLPLAAQGWLDSRIREQDTFRHAAPGFPAGPAADASLWMEWLAPRMSDAALAQRLRDTAQAALRAVPPAEFNQRQVGHLHGPASVLAFGAVAENAARSREHARALDARFGSDGLVHYRKTDGRVDYGRTHWADHANGLTGQVVATLLREAAFAGDDGLIAGAIARLRGLAVYRDTVPRGAQTWEIPLHTPDILAAAHLVDAYVLGYEITGEECFLDQARYWAWTGVPFVYLAPPAPGAVGAYSTIAVLGATNWVAPVWIGLPVQWCGLVYADALYRLGRHDPQGPWQQLAGGICAAALQQSYPVSDPDFVGLLPDSFSLEIQGRNGPAINPATVLAPGSRFLGGPWVYDFRALRRHGWLVHAPGEITDLAESASGAAFTVRAWRDGPSWLVVNRVTRAPGVRINGQTVKLSHPQSYDPAQHRLLLQLRATARVELVANGGVR